MRPSKAICAGLLVGLVSGCNRTGHLSDSQRKFDAALVTTLNDEAIGNAIIAQHTLFEFHFLSGAASLNALGQHDLGVLADHYREHGGQLNVRRGDAPDSLYAQRVAEVRRVLTEDEVETGRISVSDGPPGGEGMKADQVLVITGRHAKP